MGIEKPLVFFSLLAAVPHTKLISLKELADISKNGKAHIIKTRKVTILTAVKDQCFVLLWNKGFIPSDSSGGKSVKLIVLAQQSFPNLSI